jgi:hypothetical protein
MPQNDTKPAVPEFYIENGWVDDYPHNDFAHTCTNPCCMREGYGSHPWQCDDGTMCKKRFNGRPAQLQFKGECILCNPPKSTI